MNPRQVHVDLTPPFVPSWLDCGALIHVDAPGCGTSVVRGPTELTSRKVGYRWKVPAFRWHKSLNHILIKKRSS